METRFIIQILLVIFLPIGSLAQGITKLVSFDDISSNNLIITGVRDNVGICFRNALIDHAIWYIEIPVVIPGSIAVNQ